jgi:hypothetical protein
MDFVLVSLNTKEIHTLGVDQNVFSTMNAQEIKLVFEINA